VITIRGKIVTPTGVVDGRIAIDGGRIIEIGPGGDRGRPHYDFGKAVVVPGFIDVHMHGMGKWGMFEVAELCEVARMECRFGTTGFLPTAATSKGRSSTRPAKGGWTKGTCDRSIRKNARPISTKSETS
jgi:N-acetylglucosamine-6-phosphate deacetylase